MSQPIFSKIIVASGNISRLSFHRCVHRSTFVCTLPVVRNFWEKSSSERVLSCVVIRCGGAGRSTPPPGFRWRCTGRRLNDFPDRRQTDHDLDPLKILTCRCEMICTAQIHDLYSTDPSQEAVGTRRLVADFSAPTRYHELRTGGCWRIILVGWVSCSLFVSYIKSIPTHKKLSAAGKKWPKCHF